jgi:hypothetical protein
MMSEPWIEVVVTGLRVTFEVALAIIEVLP